MNEDNRMTVSRAEHLLEKFDVHLAEDHWTPTEDDPKGYCPTGLYLLDKYGIKPVLSEDEDPVSRGVDDFCPDYPRTYMSNIANQTGVPYSYLIGLNNGYVEQKCHRIDTDVHTWDELYSIRHDYFLGLHDGKKIREWKNDQANAAAGS
jgi:hypothetical protein